MTEHLDIERLAKQLEAANAAGDDGAARALTTGLDDADLIAVMTQFDVVAASGNVSRRTSTKTNDDVGIVDAELLHSALREAGSSATDALVWADLAAGQPAAWLRAQLKANELDVDGVAAELARDLACSDEVQQRTIHRYVRRILEGRHDVRRVTDEALQAMAGATRIPIMALTSIRDNAMAPAGMRASAARGSHDPATAPIPVPSEDRVDQLFLGREL